MSCCASCWVKKGYAFFPPREGWQHHSDLDDLVFKKNCVQVSSTPVLIYPGRDGEILMRPWSGKYQSLIINEIRNDIPRGRRRRLRLRQARRPLIGDWRDYLSEDSLEDARILVLGV